MSTQWKYLVVKVKTGMLGDFKMETLQEELDRLAAQTPLWEPGTASGYHPITIGYLAGELFRIVDPAVLARMDAYEDCDPDTAGGPEYARRLVQVPGHAVQAWTSEYVRPLHRAQVVEGKWRVSPSA